MGSLGPLVWGLHPLWGFVPCSAGSPGKLLGVPAWCTAPWQPRGSCGAQAGVSRQWHLLGILLVKVCAFVFLAELRDALNRGVETWRLTQRNDSLAKGDAGG